MELKSERDGEQNGSFGAAARPAHHAKPGVEHAAAGHATAPAKGKRRAAKDTTAITQASLAQRIRDHQRGK